MKRITLVTFFLLPLLCGCSSTPSITYSSALTNPPKKVHQETISAKSQAIYKAFFSLVAPEALKGEATDSVAFSGVDAFIAYSMEAFASRDEVQASYCRALGASSMDEINRAAKEINNALGTTYEEKATTYSSSGEYGGANLNSLWLKEDLSLADASEKTLQGLSEYYYANVYHHAPTKEALNAWFKEVAPSGFDELPEINVPEGGDASMVSTYFLKDEFLLEERTALKRQYLSKSHYLDYTTLDHSKKQVDYLEDNQDGVSYWEGEGYRMADSGIRTTYSRYLLPKENVDPRPFVSSLLKSEGTRKENVKLIIHAPYYKIKSDLDLTESIDKVGLEGLTTSALEKLVDPVEQEALACIKQCSLLKLDYNGFYAASATIVQNAGTAAPVEREEVRFDLDHPYLFEVYHDAMPLYLGYVNDPSYPAA